MKPSPFEYFKAGSLEEAIAILGQRDKDAQPLAGGQSLLAAMNMRLANPELLVDLGGIEDLRRIERDGPRLRVGATATYAQLGDDPLVVNHAPLLAAAVPHIAHPAIRNRGTIGGSLCQADPASEMPACLLALDGRVHIKGPNGEREVDADSFFVGTYTTCLEPGELLVSMDVPTAEASSLFFFDELTRRHGDFAMAGLAAAARLSHGALSGVRLAFFGVSDRPRLAMAAASLMEGRAPSAVDVEAVIATLGADIEPMEDLTTSAETKGRLMGVLLRRAITQWAGTEDQP